MKKPGAVVRTILLLAVLAVYAATLAAGPQDQLASTAQDTLTVQGARPVMEAMAVLERRYGWIVTYEDPPYIYSGDLADLTKVPTPDGRRSLFPKARRLDLPQPLPAPGDNPNPVALVNAVLKADSESNRQKTFRVFQSEYGLHVVPTRSRNVAGESMAIRPVLDARITLAGDGVSARKFLEMFCAAVSEATGTTMVLATVPRNLLLTRTVTLGVKNERARQVLIRVLQELGVPLTWRLLYSPSQPQGFYLNIDSPGI